MRVIKETIVNVNPLQTNFCSFKNTQGRAQWCGLEVKVLTLNTPESHMGAGSFFSFLFNVK